MKLTLERQIPLVFLIATVLLVVTGFFAYRSGGALNEAISWERKTQEVLSRIDQTFNLTLDAETSARGYIITGNDAFLETYNLAEPQVSKNFVELRRLLSDSPSQIAVLDRLDSLVRRKLLFVNNTIEARRSGGLNAALTQINNSQDRVLMQDIRRIIGELKTEETELLKQREEELTRTVGNTLFILFFGTTAGIISLGLANFAIFREIRMRRASDERLRVANRDLETRVEDRTRELSQANNDLKTEIGRREEAEDRRRVAVEAGGLGIWRLNPATEEAEMDERGLELFGLEADAQENLYENAFRQIHEDDLPRVESELKKSIAARDVFKAEIRVRSANGNLRWNYCVGQPVFAANGELKHVTGYCRDITESKEHEIAIRNSEEFNRSVFENSPDCVKILELDGSISAMNKNGLCLMEIDDFSRFAGRDWVSFWQKEDREAVHQAIEAARAGQTARFDGFCPTAKGTPKWWDVLVSPILGADGAPKRLIATSRDVSDRHEAERERERLLKNEQAARREAEIANRMRDDFLATVSHELRAPLNAILGWAKLLESGKLEGEMQDKATETIIRNAEAQNRLIEDLLDVSRIISGKLRLEVDKVRPYQIVEAAVETVRPSADAKRIELEITGDDADIEISGDRNRLQQVMWNLLSNAIKFTPDEGRISVRIRRAEEAAQISVTDTGVGIKPEFLPHVFNRFSQADASSIRKFGGLGLGLEIVRNITEMHGGTVSVESAGENMGTTFTVCLPLLSAGAPAGEPNSAGEANDSAIDRKNLDGLLILVVDDEEDTRQMLVQALTLHGATVVTAASAEEGFKAVEAKNPDVLISDIGMPDEDGYSLIRRIRSLDGAPSSEVKAVALTAFTQAQDKERALAAGFHRHLSKPIEIDKLVTALSSLMARGE